MSRPPQFNGQPIPERDTGVSFSWGAGPESAWGPSIKPTAAAASLGANRSSANASQAKTRTGSVSSGTFPTSNSPDTPSFSEAERTRKQQEFAESQQEQFRRTQEKLEAERQLKSAGRPLSLEELLRVFEHHKRLWNRLNTLNELSWNDFPWPMAKQPSNPDEMSLSLISAYVQCPDKDKLRTTKDRIKEHIKRWHPDRFEIKLLPKVVEDEREKVKHGAGNVARYLSELLRKENESEDPKKKEEAIKKEAVARKEEEARKKEEMKAKEARKAAAKAEEARKKEEMKAKEARKEAARKAEEARKEDARQKEEQEARKQAAIKESARLEEEARKTQEAIRKQAEEKKRKEEDSFELDPKLPYYSQRGSISRQASFIRQPYVNLDDDDDEKDIVRRGERHWEREYDGDRDRNGGRDAYSEPRRAAAYPHPSSRHPSYSNPSPPGPRPPPQEYIDFYDGPNDGRYNYRSPDDWEFQRFSDGARPTPSRQSSYIRLRGDFDRRYSAENDGYSSPYPPAGDIPIPRHTPNLEEPPAQPVWREWGAEGNRHLVYDHLHQARSPPNPETFPHHRFAHPPLSYHSSAQLKQDTEKTKQMQLETQKITEDLKKKDENWADPKLMDEQLRLLQEAGFRKREEDIRRQAEEAKRKQAEEEKRKEEDSRREEARLEDFRRQQAEKRLMNESQHFDDMLFELDPKLVDPKLMDEQLRLLQEAEFRKREEDIRRTRQERKRNDSVGNDDTGPKASYLSASSGTSPSMSRPPQFNGQPIPERSTSPSSSWGAGPASAWSSSIKPTAAASPGANRSSANASQANPKTGSVSSGTFPTTNWPYTPSFSETERTRKRQEFAESQQEQFRRAQEKLGAERRAGGLLSPEELQRVLEHHVRLWDQLNTLNELSWNDFPWPMAKQPSNPDEMSLPLVNAYIWHYPEKVKLRTTKDLIKEHIKRWHPDRFETELLPKVVEDEREKVKHGAGNVARYLSDLLNESNNRILA